MTLAEVIVLSTALVLCVGIWSIQRHVSTLKAADIQQAGIDRRAALKLQTDELAYKQQEWYVPILVELAKNPEVIKMILGNPQLAGMAAKLIAQPGVIPPAGK